MKRLLIVVFIPLLASCNWVDEVTFADFREGGLNITQGDPPEGSQPLSIVYAARSGWYLFAWIPIVPAELPQAMRLLTAEARRQGADGVAKVKVEMRLSSFFTAWSQSVALTGQCYKNR